MTEKDLLQQLVAAPYGEAEKILRQNGLWDEKKKPDDGTVRTYRMRVTGMMEVSGYVKVEASSLKEAEDLALDKANAWDFQWRDHGDVVDIEAEEDPERAPALPTLFGGA